MGQTGSPKATWPTMPSPKKVALRANVRSMNWSGMTKSVGLCSSLSEPTAETERMLVTPRLLMRVDVGAEVELGGEDAVAAAVAGEESDLAAFEGAEDDGFGGCAEGGVDRCSLMSVRPGMA